MKRKSKKIKEALDKKAQTTMQFLKKPFKDVSKKPQAQARETYPVTRQDFERLENVFGRDLF